jgi:amino acid adenylation domain-containing protein
MTLVAHEILANRKDQAQWMLHRLVPGRGICNVGIAAQVERRLRWGPLQNALDHLVWRHPGLRASLRTSGSALYKRFVPATDLTVPLRTLAGTDEGIEEQITQLVGEPFDIEGDLLLRAHRIVLPASDVICLVLHHIVADGVTAGVVLHELVELYDVFAEDGALPPRLAAPAQLFVEEPPTDGTLEYWRRHLDGVDPDSFALADARPAPARPTFAGDRVERKLSAGARAALDRLRIRTRTTGNIVLLAAYYLLLAKHGAGPDLVVGVLANARRGGVSADVVGYHVNTLPIRVAVDFGADFATLARQARDAFLTGLDHGDASFESIQHSLDTRSADWRVPLFRHAFNNMPPDRGRMTLAGVPVRSLDAYHAMSRVDLELIVWSLPEELTLAARYSTEVHDRVAVTTLLARLERLLIALDEGYHLAVGQVDCDADGERQLASGAGAARTWPPGTLADLITARAVATPQASAVDGWSYHELRVAAEAIAAELRGYAVARGDVVGLYAERSRWLAAGALGCWAVGAAYLPLDPTHPADRTAYQLADAGARVVLADRPLPDRCADGRTVLDIAASPAATGTPAECGLTGTDPAYLSYTSGSTGRPKGVVVSHGNLANVVHDFAERLAVTAGDRVLWGTTFSFDISALELFLPLAVGGEVVVAADAVRADAEALLDLVVTRDVGVLQATPTMWRHLAPELRRRLRGRRVLSGGEPLTSALAERLLADGCRLFNVYGPTETTIWSTATELTSPVPDPVPIGGPIANTTLHVTDPTGGPVPVGVPGELRIGGAGVASGYHNDAGHTAERFPIDPRHGRLYRTGDLVRQRADGVLDYLGRTDRQLKVRGYRVEPGEIEAVLETHPRVRAVAVFAERDPAGHLRLVAAVQAPVQSVDGPAAQPALAAELRDIAAARLPAAMTPSRFLILPELPLTGNGKIDYRALARAAAQPATAAGTALPDDPTERLLVEAWREVLGDPRLSVESNFFLSGGHSLLAIRLADRVGAALGRAVDFDLVFAAPTPVLLAAHLFGREEPL